MGVTQLGIGGSVLRSRFILRRTLTFTETHFYEGGSFLRRRLLSTEDAHLTGVTHFHGGHLIFTEETYFYESTRFYEVDSFQRRRLMNELPVIESLCLRKDFWDRRGANIATC